MVICTPSDVILTGGFIFPWCRRPTTNAEICNLGTQHVETASRMQPDHLLHNPAAHAVGTFAITLENHENSFMTAHSAAVKESLVSSLTASSGTGSSTITYGERPQITRGAIPLQSHGS